MIEIKKLRTVENINAKVLGAVELFEVPLNKKLIVTGMVLRSRAFVQGPESVTPIFDIGSNGPDYNNFVPNFAPGFTEPDSFLNIMFDNTNPSPALDEGELLFMKITTASDATTNTWDLDIFGYYVDEDSGVSGLKGYTTKEAIENYLLIDIDSSFDEQIDEWIEAAEEYIDHETNRDFTPAEDVDATDRTFDGDSTSSLVIDPASEITEVRFSETGDPIDADQYVLYPVRRATTNKIVLKNLKFPSGHQNIYVKAKWGYASVPKDIKLAATVIVAGIINNAWESSGEIASMTIGRYTVSYKTKEQVDDFNKISEILAYNKRYTF